jgi:hypothetical protein
MSIAKQQVINLIKELPEKIDIDELMYRLKLSSHLQRRRETKASLGYVRSTWAAVTRRTA